MQRNSESVSELFVIIILTPFSQGADGEIRTFPLPVLPTENSKASSQLVHEYIMY
jgi:hypothetical protein